MSSSWRKVKGLFWESGEAPAEGADEALSDAEFQSLLATEHAVPEQAVVGVDPSTVAMKAEAGSVTIDFQTDYDASGIPNTDEVERPTTGRTWASNKRDENHAAKAIWPK